MVKEIRGFKKVVIAASVVCGLASGFVPAQRAAAITPVPISKPAPWDRLRFDATQFVPESELKSGQMGYALTVFHGTTIERFNVEILGVLKKINNGKDLILIKVTSGPSVTRQANIAHGMSGSPVYLGNRMVGAIAYSLPFAREPIGLVTPISDMFDAWDPDLPAKPYIGLTADATPTAPGVPVSASLLAGYLGSSNLGGSQTPQSAMTFEPIMTPVMVSGMSQTGISRLSRTLSRFGLEPMAGGGAMGAPNASAVAAGRSLVPGAAVGVSLAQGDVDMTAIGTLTYRDGNRVIAFGHPFTGIGPIDAAMTTATITDLFPSVQDSTKLGAPLTTVGRIFQDRPFSVGGLIGSMPEMVPVDVTVDDQSDKRESRFHTRVINHPLLTATLIQQVVSQELAETHGSPGDTIADVNVDVDAEQVGHIQRHNTFYDPLTISNSATSDLQGILSLMSSNPFYPLSIHSVKVDITLQSRHSTAQIDHIFVPKAKFEPGDVVDIGVVVKPFKEEPVLRKVSLTIPSSTPDGTVTVTVRGGGSSTGGNIQIGNMIIVRQAPTDSTATNITQLVRKFLEQPKNNEMVATLTLPTNALDVQGEKLSILPPSLSTVMRAQHSSGLHMERDEVKTVTPLQWVLTGSQSLTITVARKNTLDTATPATPATPSTPSETAPGVTETLDTVSESDASLASDGVGYALPEDTKQGQLSGTDGSAPKVIDVSRHHGTAASPASPAPTKTASPDAANKDKTAVSPDASADTDNASKPVAVARQASVWRQETAEQFGGGTLDQVAWTSANDLRLASSPAIVGQSTSPYLWSIAIGRDGVPYAGSGDDGIIYRTGADGTLTPFSHTGELEVTALAINPVTGVMYAGTSPHGVVFEIDSAGKAQKLCTLAEKYVTAISTDTKSGNVYLATGGGTGKIYVAPSQLGGEASLLWTSQDAHLLCMAVDSSSGIVYAGSAPEGLVYAVTPDGHGRIVYNTPTTNVTGLAVGADGVIYAGTGPKGNIYKITQSAEPALPYIKPLLSKTVAGINALASDPSGGVWAAVGSTLYSIAPDDTLFAHTAASAQDVNFISLAVGADKVYAGTGDVGTLYILDKTGTSNDSATGTYTSSVHDAKLPARWGTIAWQGNTIDGGTVTLQTRTGDVSKPDETWSAWSTPYSISTGQKIASPPARYIQYRANLTGTTRNSPRLSTVALWYLTRNQPPTVHLTAPASGEALSGKYSIRWTGSDPDHDTLSYDVFESKDGGPWVPIEQKQSDKTDSPTPSPDGDSAKPAPDAPAGPAAVPTQPDASTPTGGPAPAPRVMRAATTLQVTATRDLLIQELRWEHRAATPMTGGVPSSPPQPPGGLSVVPKHSVTVTPPADDDSAGTSGVGSDTDADSAPSDMSFSATTRTWDTTKATDGSYRIKVVVSDRPSNAIDPQSAETISEPITVDNTAPTVTLVGNPQIGSDTTAPAPGGATVVLHGTATGKLAWIKSVQYSIDGSKDFSSANPTDGLFDSTSEGFTITTLPLAAGSHTICVVALNSAGMSAKVSQTVVVK